MKRICALILLVLSCSVAWAAGTCVVSDTTSTQNSSSRVPDAGVVIVTLTCTGDASTGSFPSTTIPLSGSYPQAGLNAYNLRGYYLYQVGRTPGATNPTANYTITIKDAQGVALDQALLTANGSASAAQLTIMTPATAPYPVFETVRSALTVAFTVNIVASAQITVDLVFRATL